MPLARGFDPAIVSGDDEALCWANHDEACEALDRAKGSDGSKVKYLPKPWRRIDTLVAIDANVLNGGFHQFFANAGGRYDSHLLEDVEEFGQEEFTKIVRRAWKEYTGRDHSDQWKFKRC